MFSAATLTEDQALEIAEAYFRAGREPKRMAAVLGMAAFDIKFLAHPVVKRQIARVAKRMSKLYNMEDHLEKLQEIRDIAMGDGNYKVALTAEIAVGKAAGLYENLKPVEEDPLEGKDPINLTSAEIREKLARLGGGAILEDLRDNENQLMDDGDLERDF